MAAKGTKDNPFLNLTELKKSDVYYSGNRAVKKMQELLGRELTPTERKIVAKEGYVDGYYLDSRNILTRGVGQTGTYAEGKESYSGFEKAIADSTKAANKQAEQIRAEGRPVDPNFTESLVGVNFQLGSGWTTKFPTAWDNLLSGDYEDAIEEIKFTKKGSGIASDWAKQTPTRVNDFTQAIKNQANYKPGKQSSVFTGQEIKVADASGKVPIGGIAQLDQEVVKPYNSFGLRNNSLDENVQESITTDTIDVSAPNLFDIQENARRSMMHGNYQDRMEDYAYAREQARRPYVNRYPVDSRGRGAYSTAAPMRNQAARMMGFAKGGLINTQGPRPMNNLKTQAQGLAALGRGGDSTLVHMQPEEVAGLQQLAQANGTSLTINPATGMPEAFNLGNMFKAALPMAAGYMLPGSQFLTGAGTLLNNPITVGALTGATVAGATGDDPIMGAVTGGFGGSSGAGLKGAFSGVGDAMAAVPNTGTSMMTSPTLAGGSVGSAMASDPFAALGRGFDQFNTNLGNITGTPAVEATKQFDMSGKQIGYLNDAKPAVQGDFFQKANRIVGPAAGLALGGLEESDFYEDVEFNDPRDKYNPNSKLNLNRDTGIAAALQKDTGLRLYAEGGEVGGGVTGAGLAPGTPVAGAMMGGGMGGSMAESASETISGPGGTETFSSMVASGMHPANAAAMLGMDPSPYLDTGPGMTFTGSSAAPTPSAPASTPAFTPPPMGASGPSSAPRAPSAPSASRPPVIGRDVGLDPSRYGYRGVGEVGGMPTPVGPGITKSRFEEMIRKGYKQGGYLNTGGTIGDGMSDDIQATINNNQPAALSDGEFVVPADVVSHLGNGSSDAGAKRLYDMMDKVRKARTGTTKQGREINPEKMMPK